MILIAFYVKWLIFWKARWNMNSVKVMQNFCFHFLLNVSTGTYYISGTVTVIMGVPFWFFRDCGFVVFSNLGIWALLCDLSSSEKCPAGRQARSYGACFCLDLLLHLDNPSSTWLEQLYSQQNWHHLWTQLVSFFLYSLTLFVLSSSQSFDLYLCFSVMVMY